MLFNTVAEIKAHLGTVHKNMNLDTVLSFVGQAEALYLVPVLGEGLVEQLGNLPAEQAPAKLVALRSKFRDALAYYVVLEAAPFLSVAFGDLGLLEASSEKAAPSRQWVYNNFIEAAAAAGDKLLDVALAWLDAHAADYTDELDSAEYRSRKQLVVSSAAQLGEYVATGGSRRFFLALLPTLRQVEEFELADVLGDALLEQVREGLASGEAPTADTRKLLALARPFVAHQAFANGILGLSVALMGTSLRLLSDNEAVRQRLAAPAEVVSALSQQAQAAATKYQARLQAHLDALNPAAAAKSAEVRDNTGSPAFWV
ncbi:hypothetical protein MUN81_15315 [Hymenobacter sp. 5317J-9]|uniref:DUF6712 family protein n=1 Tax=Hymenobacter sp. 5317J-9 TaxID=2932250 RepID=UPI001FD6FFE9|nr:DUF6712 family protein [Hymenobacter sp. 5317J-9]UOQ96604.1 hypothetical protein MUN81_15315 [Hymenobacter sp. 5317J-9]